MFQRMMNIVRGFFGLFVSGLEKANPRALIEAEKENLRSQIARFNDNLATHAGFVERLNRQIKAQEKQESELVAKTAALLKLGHRPQAGALALQLKNVREQLEENRKQLDGAETTFQKLIKSRDVSVREAQTKIDSLKQMLSETEMLEAQAELQEMAKGMISSIGGSGDTLARVEENISERRDKAAGRARVAANSIDTSGVELIEAEQEAMGEAALAEFSAAYGFDSPAPEAEPEQKTPAAREMGPAVPEA